MKFIIAMSVVAMLVLVSTTDAGRVSALREARHAKHAAYHSAMAQHHASKHVTLMARRGVTVTVAPAASSAAPKAAPKK